MLVLEILGPLGEQLAFLTTEPTLQPPLLTTEFS